MAKNLSAVSSFLENHYSRDKVFRTAQFSALLLSGLSQQRLPVLSEKLVRIYQQFSHVRLVLRLADDLPMLAYTLKSAFARDVRAFVLFIQVLVAILYGKTAEQGSSVCDTRFHHKLTCVTKSHSLSFWNIFGSIPWSRTRPQVFGATQ